ncbi:MAG: hypothetical protein IPP66_03145 [Anaerolineales bacterium]|nr:hypothetical protein [Anaerolineales bacterium]
MSKRFALILLLMVLTTACSSQVTVLTPQAEEVQSTLPVPLNTMETAPTATATPLTLTATEQALPIPTLDLICLGAPPPHIGVGQEVQVMVEDSDKLKLRSERRTSSDAVKMELAQFTMLKVLEGPYCVHSDEAGTSFWFWSVKVIPSGETGWVAEGDLSHYYIEALTPVTTAIPTALTCVGVDAPRIAIGQQVTVVTEDTDKLKLREIPVMSPDTVVRDLDKFTKLNVLDGPVCGYSKETSIYYWLWKVEVLPNGEIGWVAEGDFFHHFVE